MLATTNNPISAANGVARSHEILYVPVVDPCIRFIPANVAASATCEDLIQVSHTAQYLLPLHLPELT